MLKLRLHTTGSAHQSSEPITKTVDEAVGNSPNMRLYHTSNTVSGVWNVAGRAAVLPNRTLKGYSLLSPARTAFSTRRRTRVLFFTSSSRENNARSCRKGKEKYIQYMRAKSIDVLVTNCSDSDDAASIISSGVPWHTGTDAFYYYPLPFTAQRKCCSLKVLRGKNIYGKVLSSTAFRVPDVRIASTVNEAFSKSL